MVLVTCFLLNVPSFKCHAMDNIFYNIRQFRFLVEKRQFPCWETRVSSYGNDSIQGEKLAFPYMEIAGNSKQFIYRYIGKFIYSLLVIFNLPAVLLSELRRPDGC